MPGPEAVEDPYDSLPYASRPFPEAHPDRMAVVARLFGMEAANPASARILELGCGSAGHLIPIAVRCPEATVVGLDRSSVAIADARAAAEAVGAPVTLIEADLLHASKALSSSDLPERYDYIIVHGVFSWVPDEVRAAILRIIKEKLAPQGVAYVSYNTFPGWHLRGMVAEMLKLHAATFDDRGDQLVQSRAFGAFLAENIPAGTPFGHAVTAQLEVLLDQPEYVWHHDLLSDDTRPLWFKEFLDGVQGEGLSYLGDADPGSMLSSGWSEEVRETLDLIAPSMEETEQYLDVLNGRMFRRSLIVHSEAEVSRQFLGARLEGMYVGARVEAVGRDDGKTVFRTRFGDELAIQAPLLQAALGVLAKKQPALVPFEKLTLTARRRAGTPDADADTLAMGREILVAFLRGMVELYPRDVEVTGKVSKKPVACPVVRMDAAAQKVACANLMHEFCEMEDFDRALLPMLDGATTIPKLITQMVEHTTSTDMEFLEGQESQSDPKAMAAFLKVFLPDRLQLMAKAALLKG